MALRKRTWLIALWAIPVLLVAAVIVSQWQLPVQAQQGEAGKVTRTISVNGTGEITVEPDVAYVNLGVLTKGKTADEAQQANADIYDKVNKVLFDQYKLDAADVKTIGFNVRPDYSYQEGKEPTITGYTATHTVKVTYRDLDSIGELLDAVAKAGVNQINNVQFATEKSDEYEKEAMKLAMKDARDKAELLASTEGQTIKGAISISQNGGSGGVYLNSTGFMAMDSMEAMPKMSTSVNPGEITISTNVSVVYEF